MPEPISTFVGLFLGAKAAEIFWDAIKGQAEDQVTKLIGSAKTKILGDAESKALEKAYKQALSNAYQQIFTGLGKTLELIVESSSDFVRYRVPAEEFLRSRKIADHLLNAIRTLPNTDALDPELLEAEWNRSGREPLPVDGIWNIVVGTLRKGATEQAIIDPQLREILNATTLQELLTVQKSLLGVQVRITHEQYARVLKSAFSQVLLANIAPPNSVDPGVLTVSDIFEPQHVRKNPPPVEIAKDELEALCRSDGSNSSEAGAAIICFESGQDGETLQNLSFQRSAYTDQPAIPVLDVISQPIHGDLNEDTPKQRRLVITGEPGSGKSMLLRYLLLEIVSPATSQETTDAALWKAYFTKPGKEYFPLLIELREYHFTCEKEQEVNSFLDYVDYLGQTMSYGIDAQWLDERLRYGNSIIMFDGLDEIFDRERRKHVMKQIAGFAENYPLARIVVTSRPHGYKDEILRPAGFEHYRLQDLDRNQKGRFTKAWFSRVFPGDTKSAKQRIDRVLKSVDQSPSVRWLAGNPLLLTIMCLIARERELPEERAEFYEQCLDVLVHQWEVNNHLESEDLAFLTVSRKKELLRKIAFEMQAKQAGLRGNFIQEDELVEITQQWFETRYPDLHGAGAAKAAILMVHGLWERNYVLCPRGPKLYGFLHRTFMEFLTATEFVWRFEKTNDFSFDDLKSVILEQSRSPEWTEVLRLICGEIGEEYATGIVSSLLTHDEFTPQLLDNDNQPRALVNALRCMGEIRDLRQEHELCLLAIKRCSEFLQKVQIDLGNEDNFLRSELLLAMSDIQIRWPELRMNLDDLLTPDSFMSYGYQVYPEMIAIITWNWDLMHSLLVSEPSKRLWRKSAIIALGFHWSDDRTREVLEESALHDPSEAVRYQAVKSLVVHRDWHDSQLAAKLMHVLQQDCSGMIRSFAAICLLDFSLTGTDSDLDVIADYIRSGNERFGTSALLSHMVKKSSVQEEWVEALCLELINSNSTHVPLHYAVECLSELLDGNPVKLAEHFASILAKKPVSVAHFHVLTEMRSRSLVLERFDPSFFLDIYQNSEANTLKSVSLYMFVYRSSWDSKDDMMSFVIREIDSELQKGNDIVTPYLRPLVGDNKSPLAQYLVGLVSPRISPDVVCSCIQLLSMGRDDYGEDVLDAVWNVLHNHDSHYVQLAAIRGLLYSGSVEVDELFAIADRLIDEKEDEHECHEVLTIFRVVPGGHSSKQLAIITKWMNHSELAVRVNGTRIAFKNVQLGLCGDRAEIASRLLESIKRNPTSTCIPDAISLFYQLLSHGDAISQAKSAILSKDLDGFFPYLDIRDGLPLDHLDSLSEKFDLDEQDLDAVLNEMSQTLGWNISEGLMIDK